MIATAAAAEAAQQGAHHPAFYATAEFWVAVGIVLTVALVYKPLMRAVTAALDVRAQKVQDRLDEAERLRQEARDILEDNRQRREQALKDAEEIVETAKAEAEQARERGRQESEDSLARRERQMKDRIGQAEADAVAEVRHRAVEIAVAATEDVLSRQMTAQKGNALIDKAIQELPAQLH